MAIHDVLNTLTLAGASILLGLCIPLLINVPDSDINRRVEFIVVTALVTVFAVLAVLYGLRALLPVFGGKRLALGVRWNASLVVILLALGAGFMGGLSTWANQLPWLRWRRYFSLLTDEQYQRVEALFNGTAAPPSYLITPGDEWKRWELSNYFRQWAYESLSHKDANIIVMVLATLTLVIGWILVAVLVFQLIAVVIPSQRRIWFESTPGGITLRWKDGAIALPEESESEHLARGEGSA